MKTAIIDAYRPHGTRSAFRIDLSYRSKTNFSVSGPYGDRERLLSTALQWAKKEGFTHYRRFGEERLTSLEYKATDENFKPTSESANSQIIYVPTEAGLPNLEAGRLNR